MIEVTVPVLETAELAIAPMTIAFMVALRDGRRADAERELGAALPPDWALPAEVLQLRIAQLRQDPSAADWLLHTVVRQRDRQLVGNVGFHAPPGRHPFERSWPAAVELGYDIAEGFRRRGHATAACAALVDWVRSQPVQHVLLSIAPANEPSVRVAVKLGFAFAHEYEHEHRSTERLYVLRLR
jgi:RimJ/RimL family protein N-acetyltransferase